MELVRIVAAPACLSARPQRSRGFRRQAPHASLHRRATQAVAAGGILLSTLAVAAPSWAGPMSGC